MCRWPTVSARSMRWSKAGKIRAIGLSQFHRGAAAGSHADCRRERADPARARCRPGTIWSSARSSKASCATRRSRMGSAIFPFYSLANGFLTGKYRSKADLDKSTRGDATSAISKGRGLRVLDGARRGCRRNRRARSRPSRLPGPMAQPAITAPLASATSVEQLAELTAAMDLKLTPEQLARSTKRARLSEAASASLGGTSSMTSSWDSKWGLRHHQPPAVRADPLDIAGDVALSVLAILQRAASRRRAPACRGTPCASRRRGKSGRHSAAIR